MHLRKAGRTGADRRKTCILNLNLNLNLNINAKQGGPAPMAQPHPCDDCYGAHAKGHHCLACPGRDTPQTTADEGMEAERVPHSVLSRLKAYHAPSSVLNGQVRMSVGVGDAARWMGWADSR